ncbi:hypothetical protein CMV30_04465 [Nibricoccus aquaticus]|uniref:Uncharacterized protein n=1 Tax=Nibricoccus aquaticus TaxID=2576891 RepID=A0A290Q4Q3_9BACT|nr:hypothetical protein [Nibricoccus aquaticus]ATC63267.1 hypothetical protein CMV30_04465 [Nibricoccus aquaticus]
MSMKVLRTLLIIVSVVSLNASDSKIRDDFLKQATDQARLSNEAKTHTFFLHLFISGGWGPETASYEVRYDGPLEIQELLKNSLDKGVIIRRDLKGETRTQLDKYRLAEFVGQCIDQELFELGPKKHVLERPQIKTDGCDFWVFIKYGEAENFFQRTDESAPVGAIYSTLKKLIQDSQAPQEKGTAKSQP